MALKSALFSANARHVACQAKDSAHYVLGQTGPHIADIQAVLNLLDDLVIDEIEREQQRYGRSTAAAVLAFKRKRKIVNRTYQTAEDDIVGKMTITALDEELALFEAQRRLVAAAGCPRTTTPGGLLVAQGAPVEHGLTLKLLTAEERDVIV